VTFNHGVAGSSPAALTKKIKGLPKYLPATVFLRGNGTGNSKQNCSELTF
jgi:hypothetical protein